MACKKNIIDSVFDVKNAVKGSTSWKKNIWFLPNKKKLIFPFSSIYCLHWVNRTEPMSDALEMLCEW